jgi:hypothetical protein
MSPPSHNGYGYDRRFVGLFLGELLLRGSPKYPEGRCFTALTRADYDFRRLGPLKLISGPGTGHKSHFPKTAGLAEGTGKQLYAHNYGDRDPDRLSAEVSGACSRWLNSRGLHEPVRPPIS